MKGWQVGKFNLTYQYESNTTKQHIRRTHYAICYILVDRCIVHRSTLANFNDCPLVGGGASGSISGAGCFCDLR